MIGGKRVLIVEDEFLVAAMLEDELADHGAIVIGPAASLEVATGLVAAKEFDAVVLDWNLGGESSEPLGHALLGAGIPFVISTGYGAVPPAFAQCPVLAKPYDPAALVALLGRLLAPIPGT